MSLITSFRVVGYDVDHWACREVSRVTGARVNHIGFRFQLLNKFDYETFVLAKPTDTLVPVRKLQKLLPKPVVMTPSMYCDTDPLWFNKASEVAMSYGHGNYIYPYVYHYLGRHVGMPVPKSCTDLVYQCLRICGMNVQERFYPHQLLKEVYKQCM